MNWSKELIQIAINNNYMKFTPEFHFNWNGLSKDLKRYLFNFLPTDFRKCNKECLEIYCKNLSGKHIVNLLCKRYSKHIRNILLKSMTPNKIKSLNNDDKKEYYYIIWSIKYNKSSYPGELNVEDFMEFNLYLIKHNCFDIISRKMLIDNLINSEENFQSLPLNKFEITLQNLFDYAIKNNKPKTIIRLCEQYDFKIPKEKIEVLYCNCYRDGDRLLDFCQEGLEELLIYLHTSQDNCNIRKKIVMKITKLTDKLTKYILDNSTSNKNIVFLENPIFYPVFKMSDYKFHSYFKDIHIICMAKRILPLDLDLWMDFRKCSLVYIEEIINQLSIEQLLNYNVINIKETVCILRKLKQLSSEIYMKNVDRLILYAKDLYNFKNVIQEFLDDLKPTTLQFICKNINNISRLSYNLKDETIYIIIKYINSIPINDNVLNKHPNLLKCAIKHKDYEVLDLFFKYYKNRQDKLVDMINNIL